jgi:P4 family phage/plasmid primase-like protien
MMDPPSQHEAQGVPAGGWAGGGNQGISIEGLNKYYTRWSNKEYRELKLLEAVRVLGNGRGLDLVIVDGEKKPIHKWRFESLRPSDLEEIVKKNPNAEGVGVVPGVLIYDPFHHLAILDIDDLELGTKHLETVFGKDWREKLLGGKDAFVILTGPRPKGEWECDCQSPGVDCKCVNKKTGEVKSLSELPRGLAVGVRIPNECAPMRCIRGEGIEVRAGSCYEVVYGRHPSGAFYQPARWVGDRFVNIELHELGGGAFVDCEEYKRLVEVIKGEVVGFTEEEWKEWEEAVRKKQPQPQQAQVTQAQATPSKPVKYRRLGEEQKQKVVEALRRFYKSGTRQNLWLAIAGWGAWHQIDPLDVADVLLRLYRESGDTDDLRVRGATIVYSYTKRGLPVDKQELSRVLGVEPYGDVVEPEKVSWKSLLKEVLGSDAEVVIKVLRSVVGRVSKGGIRELRRLLRAGTTARVALFVAGLVRKRFRHIVDFVTPDGEVGLYCWSGKRYVPCEGRIESFISWLYSKASDAETRIRYTTLKREVIELLKDWTKREMPEEENAVAFDNCVLDWATLECTPHDPRKIVLHYIPHELDTNVLKEALASGVTEELVARYAPKTLEAFKQWAGEQWQLLFEIIGSILYPKPIKKAFLIIGDADSGKSTFINYVRELIGDANCAAEPPQAFIEDKFATGMIYRKLANFWADLPTKALTDPGVIKVLTGGDVIKIERKYKDPISWRPYTKHVFSANEPPPVHDADKAFWRRWLVIEFIGEFDKPIPEFEKTLLDEAPVALAITIASFKAVLDRGAFSFEGTPEDAKHKWLARSNTVYAFMEWLKDGGALVEDPTGRVKASDLYEYYVKYCEANGNPHFRQNRFTMELKALGYKVVREHGYTKLVGYILNRDRADELLNKLEDGEEGEVGSNNEEPQGLDGDSQS